MSKIAALIVMLCAVLAVPALGEWIYDGTYAYISEPDSDADPNGTWWWEWDGQGSVSGDAFNLYAGGWTRGECGVALWPATGTGLSESTYVSSSSFGYSSYHWVPGGSKYIDLTVETTIYSPTAISYNGSAVDDTHVSVVYSTSGASASAGGGGTGVGYSNPGGSGYGEAVTQSGSGAWNSPGDVTVSQDWADWWYPPPYHPFQGDIGQL